MPSVGMRRTTRVFGVVKGVDGARVLRSGRRLWPDFGESKVRRSHDVDNWNWNCLLKDHGKGKGHKTAGLGGGGGSGRNNTGSKACVSSRNPKEELFDTTDHKEEEFRPKRRRKVKTQHVGIGDIADKMFGIVYSRKRKRLDEQKSDFSHNSRDELNRLQLSNRQRRTLNLVSACRPVLTVVVDSSSNGSCWISSVFRLVLRYTRKANLKLSALTAFFMSQSISGVYSDHGIRLLREPPDNARGICKFFGARKCLPLFSLDFAAAPLCFMHMHHTLLLRTTRQSFVFVNKSLSFLESGEIQLMEESVSDDEVLVSEASGLRNNGIVQLHPSVRASKLTGRNAQCKNSLNSRSFQKRRSSLRRRRARNISHGVHKVYNGALVSDLIGSRKNGSPFSSIVSTKKLRSPLRNNLASNSEEAKSPKNDIDSLCCSANILVIDSDKCSREEGFNVLLEFSSSQEWVLVIKRDESVRYTHKAQKVMRPCSCNRFTHAIIWTGDENWKLEFCNRQDWFIFKDLYKECSDRNVSAPNFKVIPIPGVQEISGFENENGDYPSFSRPFSYISVNDDELSRAMARNTGIYDMDSDDEEWLKTFNGRFSVENGQHDHISEDNFELMIDGFEKDYFHSPNDYTHEKAVSSVSHLGKREVVEAVYSYWMIKRKQKKGPLLRVFQGHQVKKNPIISTPIFRKRRSFKRQASQLFGRGKQPSLLHSKVADQDALEEEQNAMLRIKEVKDYADKSIEIAITKRQRAQILMENADLAIHKAMMAIRIAESAQSWVQSREVPDTLFLDEWVLDN